MEIYILLVPSIYITLSTGFECSTDQAVIFTMSAIFNIFSNILMVYQRLECTSCLQARCGSSVLILENRIRQRQRQTGRKTWNLWISLKICSSSYLCISAASVPGKALRYMCNTPGHKSVQTFWILEKSFQPLGVVMCLDLRSARQLQKEQKTLMFLTFFLALFCSQFTELLSFALFYLFFF